MPPMLLLFEVSTVSQRRLTSSRGLMISALTILYLLVCVARAPDVLIGGRFWAEEGSVMWSHARSSNFRDSLLFNPGGGYLNLYANGLTYIASMANLRYAPYVTSWISLLLAGGPAVVLFRSPLVLNFSQRWKAACCTGLLLIPSVTEPDIFANSLQHQVHFGVLAAVLLLVNFSLIRWKTILWSSPFFLVMALSGVHAAVVGSTIAVSVAIQVLSDFRQYGTWRIQDKKTLVVSSVFLFGLMIQLLIYVANSLNLDSEITHSRGNLPQISEILTYIASNLATLGTGRVLTERVLEEIPYRTPSYLVGIAVLIGGAAIAYRSMRASLTVESRKGGNHKRVFLGALCTPISRLCLAYLITVLVTMAGFVSPIPNARYQTVPTTVFFLILVSVISQVRGVFLKGLFFVVIAVSSFIGLRYDPWQFLDCRSPCTTWATQIKETEDGKRSHFSFWPLNSSPPFEAPVVPPADWCDDFNALVSWSCND